MKNRIIVILFVLLIFSCTHIQIDKPEGFAVVQDAQVYKAISPEGMPFRVRSFENYPVKDLQFWQQY